MARQPSSKDLARGLSNARLSSGEVDSKEKNVMDKAMDGTVSEFDYKSVVLETVKNTNGRMMIVTECSLSKGSLDWGLKGSPCPVVDFDEQKYSQDSIQIMNNSKSKKVYWEVIHHPNPKFEIIVTPDNGVIKKGTAMEVQFKMRAFCTTKVFQIVKFAFSFKKPKAKKANGDKNKLTWRSSIVKSPQPPGTPAAPTAHIEEESGILYLSYKVESELSSSLDYDEIEVGQQLAKGGFGTVFKGVWRNAECAIKELNVQELVESEQAMVRREIRLMGKLLSSYIVTYMGSTQITGQPVCIIMEYIKGGSLTDLLQQPLSDRFKCKLCLDVAKGMSYLHTNNVCHRDIKPDNMLVVSRHPDADINLKITDFGTSTASTFSAAKLSDPTYQVFSGSTAPTQQPVSPPVATKKPSFAGYTTTPVAVNQQQSQVQVRKLTKGVGTLIYQAPEIIQGRTDFTVDKTDIYSYAMLLLEVFTQKTPYSDPPYSTWSKWDIEKFVSSGKRLEIPNTVLPPIRDLIVKCWDQTPTNRPSFPDIKNVVQQVMDSLPPDQLYNPAAPAAAPAAQAVPAPAPASPPASSDEAPIPSGDTSDLGWAGDISRVESENKLKDQRAGTFLLRWSKNTKSYVLSFVARGGGFQHIAYIQPIEGGKITVDKEDGQKAVYDNIKEYIRAMKESNIIGTPWVPIIQEDQYGKTPIPQKK
eukprot:TRINITY_DN2876_c0_g1_i1.p1 TRINITY_DN2876_c0_g1~~TRINITY_DN2876_c0_g1_i1.p1  ORF type:complete len:698 (-),score=190.67 TRINITY_DN2876_c0_g1_i1:105-2198(-)